MLLKYYCSGWNYIDNIESVKVVNFKTFEIYSESAFKNNYYLDIKNDKVFKVSENSDDIPSTGRIDIEFYNFISNILWEKIKSIGEYVRFIEVSISNEDIKSIIWRYKSRVEIKDCEEKEVMDLDLESFRVICYTQNGNRKAVCFLKDGYLCNDSGKTIESLG